MSRTLATALVFVLLQPLQTGQEAQRPDRGPAFVAYY
jgi:hypothetical protein